MAMALRSPVAKKASSMSSSEPSSSPLPGKRQPVLLSRPVKSRGALCAEVAGGTAADCAAICCCCPCGIISLLLLAMVKLPAEMCKKAFTRRKRKKNAKERRRKSGGGDGLLGDEEDDVRIIVGGEMVVGSVGKGLLLGWPAEKSPSVEVSEMDREMWAHFYGAGFWRSPSQRES